MKHQECVDFLSKVIIYRLSGVQFPGLQTHYRPSTELENHVVIFGCDNGVKTTAENCHVSLQSRTRVTHIDNVPTQMQREANACMHNNAVYLSGIGAMSKETWRWDSIGGWTKCGNMIQGRRRHCATFVKNTSMYALGGWVGSTTTII